MYVLGTAGHVDHGKSTLVKALTGIDPDRLKEEKDRQMTIDLGFAWYKLPSGSEVGIVDVPGHRDFIENMLAGVGGIDAVLFIIAADEGVMPQTREHLDILNLLQIRNGLIVLTKTDLVEESEWLDLVENDIRGLVKNTSLAEAAILRVSAMTGQGLAELGSAIDSLLAQCPPKANKGKARLPIDRVFTVKGFGTVVTGTLIDGEFTTGQQVDILPGGRQARIRGLQNHKKAVEIASPGSRTAVNLAGVEQNDLQRGMVIASPGFFHETRRLDVKIQALSSISSPIRHNDWLKCFIGTAQTLARIRVLGEKEIPAGAEGWAQLEFEHAIPAEKGDHLILRRPSPGETIAGGSVLNVNPSRRYKRFAEATIKKLTVMDSGSEGQILLANLEAQSPIWLDDFVQASGVEEIAARQILDQMTGDEILQIKSDKERQTLLVTWNKWQAIVEKVLEKLDQYYRQHPLQSGIEKRELVNFLKLSQKHSNLLLRQMVNSEILFEKEGRVGVFGRQVIFSADQEKAANAILKEFDANPYAPPSSQELARRYETDLLNAMIEKGMLVRLTDDIALQPGIYQKMTERIKEFLEKETTITLAQVRDMFQTSRKYALAILEHLDQSGVTQRQGDHRILNRS
jgi:selenocysteine-specific elongation factor